MTGKQVVHGTLFIGAKGDNSMKISGKTIFTMSADNVPAATVKDNEKALSEQLLWMRKEVKKEAVKKL